MDLWGPPDWLTKLLHLLQAVIPVECLTSCAGFIFYFVDPTQHVLVCLFIVTSCGATWHCIRWQTESTGTLFYLAIQITLNSDRFASRLNPRRYSSPF